MSYLAASDIVADYLKGRVAAVDLLGRLASDGLAISIITFAEVYEGIYYGREPERNEAIFRRLLAGVDVLGINRAVARRFARIRGELRARGQPLPQLDVFIAATALQHDLLLVTRNIRRRRRIAGLQLHEPSSL